MNALEITEKLKKQIRDIGSAPFLFIGSGLSRRYLNLGTWSDLLRQFTPEPKSKPLEFYSGQVDGDLPKTASLIAKDFYHHWWKSPKFKQSRTAHESSITTFSDPLKLEISNF